MKLSLSVLALSSLSLVGLAAPADDGKCAATATAAGEKTILETAVAAGDFNTLASALKAADLIEPLSGKGPFTVFAPTDAAFAALPEGTLKSLLQPKNKGLLTNILTYHVVAGDVPAKEVVKLKSARALNGQRLGIRVSDEGVSVAGVKVTKTDIQCSNGVIHVIDAVMMPATQDLVETAVAAGSFKTLAAALEAAGLVEALQGEGPFTVFAPSDEAFAALPKGTVESLLKPENRDQLTAILKLHVVAGRVYADQLETGDVATLGGAKVRVTVGEAGVTVGKATVRKADLETTNGVIHVIDSVLLPE